MSAGLFELRKDPITGWWVATIVDRDFDRSRFARPASPIDDGGDCQNCRLPAGEGVRVRVLKDYAFHVVGTEQERDELDMGIAQISVADVKAAGSWRTISAPPGEHRGLEGSQEAPGHSRTAGSRERLTHKRGRVGMTNRGEEVRRCLSCRSR